MSDYSTALPENQGFFWISLDFFSKAPGSEPEGSAGSITLGGWHAG